MNEYVGWYGCHPKVVTITEQDGAKKRLSTLRDAARRLDTSIAVLRHIVGDGDITIYRLAPRDDYRICILEAMMILWGEPDSVAASGGPG